MRHFLQSIPPLLITFLAVAGATCLKIFFRAEFHMESPYLIFFSAIAISAVFGGFLQGVFAVLLSAVIVLWVFIRPDPDLMGVFLRPHDAVQSMFFMLDGLLVAGIGAFAHRSNLKAGSLLADARESERQAKENDFRFRKVYESKMLGLLFTRRDGRILEANDYFLQMLGYTREDLEQNVLSWHQVTHGDDLARSLGNWQKMSQGELTEPFEKEYVAKNGERVPVLLGSSPLDSETAVTFVLDMRARKEMETQLALANEQLEARVDERTLELKNSERFLSSVIENIPNMIFVKDAEKLSFVRFNKAGEDLLGHSQDQMLGKSDREFFPPDQAENFISFDRKVLAEKKVVDIPEEPISTRFGIRYLHTKKIPVYDESGRAKYLLGISEDITEKKALEQDKIRFLEEQAARREAEKNANRMEFLSEAGAALGESLETRQMLEAFCQTVTRHFADCCIIDLLTDDGVDFQEMIFDHREASSIPLVKEFRQKYPIDWLESRGVANVVRTGRAELVREFPEERIRSLFKDDEFYERACHHRIESAMIIPLKLYGRVLGAMSLVSYDVNHIYDDVDLSVAQELARRVSIALENSRLYASAESANRAKSDFLANMSHEIRTPLGAMLGFAELVSEGSMAEDQKEGVSTIIRNGRQLLKIVDEILDLSKVESDRIRIEEVDFDLRQLIHEVLSLLEVQAKDKRLTLSAEIHPDLPTLVKSDPTRLRQILINVIGNAIKFTSAGFVRVGIHPVTGLHEGDRAMLEVSVTDTGIGLSKEEATRLFQPFAQADESTTRRFGGTGLGLFLARKFARLLGGDLILEWSQPGEGSHFIATVELRPPSKSVSVESKKTEVSGEVSGSARILIVDDAPDNRVLISLYMSKGGYQVETAENGAEGVEKALSKNFDLVLMDIQMPEMDGFEAVRRLRERNYEKPIIALTAHAMKGDRELCLEKGFSDYMSKPINREELLGTVRRQLDSSSGT
ncbi:MAG: response regulator [Bdellovibrionaceae bacterium]|nr:response regulator [Pseudobdellovibrionaceae bacterium]